MDRFKNTKDNDSSFSSERATFSLDSSDNEFIINPDELNKELMDQPLRYRKWANLLVEAKKMLAFSKQELNSRKGALFVEYKTSSKKQPSDSTVKSYIDAHPEIIQLERRVIELESTVDKFTHSVRAMNQRADALKDLCANKRKELID